MDAIDGSRSALLIVHLQHDIVSEGTAFGAMFHGQAHARQVVARVNDAADAVRAAGGLVVPLRIAFQSGHADLNPNMLLLQLVAQAGCLVDGEPGAELVPELTVADTDLVVTHTRPGPFTDSELDARLRERGVQTVVVCGVATNASVEAAVRQAADLGYRVVLLEDACSAADEAAHQASAATQALFAEVATVAELTTALS